MAFIRYTKVLWIVPTAHVTSVHLLDCFTEQKYQLFVPSKIQIKDPCFFNKTESEEETLYKAQINQKF